MRRFFSSLSIIVCVARALAACGSTASAPSSPDAACTAYFDAVCTELEACSPVFPLLDGDHDACVTRRSSDCKKAYLGPGSKETASELEACFRALAPASCDALDTVLFENFELPSECVILHGDGAPGAPCAGPDQCASAVCIEQAGYVEDDDPCGHCGSGQPSGGKCETLRDCARGLTCANNGFCVPYAAVGKPCDPNHPCHASLRCLGGTCVPLAAAGETCAASTPSCATDLECNAVRGVCGAPIATGGVDGASCGITSSGDADACARGFICNTVGNTSTCLRLATAGEECVDRPCTLPLRCIHATCQLQDAAACR